MRTFCITLPECPERTEKACAHFKERGIYELTWFNGIHAERFGLATCFTYELDNPGTNFKIGFKPTGIWLSHWALLSALNLLCFDDYFMVLEVDAKLPVDWHTRMVSALNALPKDWDCLYIGSCCVSGRPKKHVKGELYECQHMLCSHAIIWAKKALPVVLETQRKIYSPWDISLMLHTLPRLKSYVVLPRIIEQWDTNISP